jgi:murein DD-endopeptidase MepM/ murein hydrolase activator NlpD
LFFFIAVWWLFCSTLDTGSVNVIPSDQTSRLLSTLSLTDYKRLISYVVKPGDTFLGILSRYGVPSDKAITCFSRLNPLGLVALIPGDSMVLTRVNSGPMTAVSLLHRLENWYTVSLDGPEIKADKKPVAVSSERCIVRGVLSSSLSEDMNKMGVDDACVSKFADIFGWDVNFFVDPQKGDAFEIIFEKKFAEGRFVGYGDILAARYVNRGHAFNALGVKGDNGQMRYYDLDGNSLQKQFLKAPLKFTHISSGFTLHRLHPVLGIVRPHLGVDYAAPAGTPVYASADGVVTFCGFYGGFGNHIRIRHGNSYETYYGHLRGIAKGIRVGMRVSQGDLLGTVGATGIATGPHLDYRMSISGRFVNPLTVSLPREKSVGVENMARFLENKRQWRAIFDLRFRGRTGCFVFDINDSNPNSKSRTLSLGGSGADRLPPS